MAIKTCDIIPPPNFEFIPDELKEYTNWLLWQAEPKKDNPEVATKKPVTIDGKPFYGWNNPKNLYSFEAVEDAFQTGKFSGIGFAFAGTDFICIDLDNEVSTDHISKELLDLIIEGYTEISPSGKGYHIWIKGSKPPGMGKVGKTKTGERLEVFGGSGWVTVTGRLDWPFPRPIKENQSLIIRLYESYFIKSASEKQTVKTTLNSITIADLEKIKETMFNSRKGKKILALWKGDTSLYGGDHSSADLALCRYLAFYANGDYYTVDTLFRQSGLYREKWDQRRGNTTYGGMTIAKAIADYSDGLQATSINLEKVEDFEVKKIDGTTNTYREGDSQQSNITESIRNTMDTLLLHIKMQEEFNHSLLKQIERQQNYFEEQLKRERRKEREIIKILMQLLEQTSQIQDKLEYKEEKKEGFLAHIFGKNRSK